MDRFRRYAVDPWNELRVRMTVLYFPRAPSDNGGHARVNRS
jgi:hypothetical protein